MSYIYGLLKTAIETLLLMVYKVTGNFGIAIIGATIIIKIILLPLTLKQDKSMKNMKKLQPEMEKIKEQYKNDPKMQQQKTKDIYQKQKVNPAAGSIPLHILLPF